VRRDATLSPAAGEPWALAVPGYVKSQVGSFLVANWQTPPYPRIYIAPHALEAGAHVNLHAKCVVADEQYAMVGSANFTNRGQAQNIEVGARVESRDTQAPGARDLDRKWAGLWPDASLHGSASRSAPPATPRQGVPEGVFFRGSTPDRQRHRCGMGARGWRSSERRRPLPCIPALRDPAAPGELTGKRFVHDVGERLAHEHRPASAAAEAARRPRRGARAHCSRSLTRL
jgi:hypothetical protein